MLKIRGGKAQILRKVSFLSEWHSFLSEKIILTHRLCYFDTTYSLILLRLGLYFLFVTQESYIRCNVADRNQNILHITLHIITNVCLCFCVSSRTAHNQKSIFKTPIYSLFWWYWHLTMQVNRPVLTLCLLGTGKDDIHIVHIY